MGIKVSESSRECQNKRLKIKERGQQMKQVAVQGTGLSPWEAKVLVESIEEVYFSDADLKEIGCGRMRYSCVSSKEGAGKPLVDCEMATVTLTMMDPEDDEELPLDRRQGSIARRQRKIVRIADEAREQGGLLTQEDLAALLLSDVRTVRRDIGDLRERGIEVATRGQQKDIGPGVTHRGKAVQLWLEGKEPADVARAINHSLGAVENYLEKFKRVAYLRRKHFDDYETALTIGISVNSVKTYAGIYESMKHSSFFASRMKEIELVGEQHYLAQDEKKDLALSKDTRKGGKSQ